MRRRHFEKALHRDRRRIGLAEAVAAVLVEHLYNDGVGSAVESLAELAGEKTGMTSMREILLVIFPQ